MYTPRYKEKYQNSSIRISSLDQTLLTHLIKDGYYYRHITSLKKAMSKKKEIIKEIFISRNIKYQETELSFIIDIDKDIEIIKKHLDDAFINVKFVSDYYIDNKDDRLIISYNSIPLSKIKDAISKLLDLAFSN